MPTTTSTPASRSRWTASARLRTDVGGQHRVGDVVDADQDHGDVGRRSAGPGRPARPGRRTGRRPTANSRRCTRRSARSARPLAEVGAGRLLDPVDAVAGGARVAEQRDLDRRARAGRGRTTRWRRAAGVSAGSPIALRASVASVRQHAVERRARARTRRPRRTQRRRPACERQLLSPRLNSTERAASGSPVAVERVHGPLDWRDAVRRPRSWT